MGEALLAAPALPFTSEYLLKKGDFPEIVEMYAPADPAAARPVREAWASQMPCWRANGRTASEAGASNAAVSPRLKSYLDSAGVPSFSEVDP